MAIPIRTIRVEDDQWKRWQSYAKTKGYPVSTLIKRAVEDWLAEPALRRTEAPPRQEQTLAKKDVKPDPKVKPKPKK